mmetsp:Transcript_102416/g.165069  ORF Transcript_102416/g.165069 Transcript_102416/m.165069 type:complete len:86 (-) Transcript_102416:342-599(-)
MCGCGCVWVCAGVVCAGALCAGVVVLIWRVKSSRWLKTFASAARPDATPCAEYRASEHLFILPLATSLSTSSGSRAGMLWSNETL